MAKEEYELVVGLEVHAQLMTRSKAYSSEPNLYGAMPNTLIGPVSLGHPGTLPRINKLAIDLAVRFGLATGCTIARYMHFARKNYFYPDLPKGYQITQDTTPICTLGRVDIKDQVGNEKTINITRAHLEEDAGKSLHDQDPFDTLVDLNRAGVPLIEIVSEPDIRSTFEAHAYLTTIRQLLRYLDICDGNMEEGSLRCDANVSVRKHGEVKLGTRTEVKNLNSIRNVQRAIDFEMGRQIEILESGGFIAQETMNFDAATGRTSAMRSKELAHDYRYFPEPDLGPVVLTDADIDRIKSTMPELPENLVKRYTSSLGLSAYDAGVLTSDKETAAYFDALISECIPPKTAANWITVEIKGYLNANAMDIIAFPVRPSRLAEIIRIVLKDKISHGAAASKLLPEMISHPDSDPLKLAKEMGLIQNSDEAWIADLAAQVLAEWPQKVEAYKAGNKSLLGLFMGELMKKSNGKANPKAASESIKQQLEL